MEHGNGEGKRMTLEQAIEVLISRYNSGVIRSRTNDDEWRLATETAIAALRSHDPITGLVPCGCGGVAEELFDGFSFDGDGMECNDYLVKCKKCGMQTQVIQTWNEKARDIWNTAMGWKGGAE